MPLKNTLFFLRPDDGSGSGDGGTGGGTGDPDPGGTGGGSPGGDNGDPGGTGGADDAQANSELEKARREAAKYRTERNTAQERVKELEGASKSEVEKLNDQKSESDKKAEAAEEKARILSVQIIAGQCGVAREAREDVARLLPKDAVEDWEDDAAVTKVIKSLVKDKPYLAGKTAGGSDGGEGGDRQTTGDMNTLIRQGAGRG